MKAERGGRCARRLGQSEATDSANDVFVVGKMRLAMLAAVYLGAIKVCVIRQTHDSGVVLRARPEAALGLATWGGGRGAGCA